MALMSSEARILVVEDDTRLQSLLRSRLAAHGFSVRAAGSGEEALLALAGEEDAPALILLDISLPGIDGIEVCRRIRAAAQPVPIILVTAAADPRTKVSVLELGADDYLTKPFHMEELIARIRAVLRRARPASSASSVASSAAASAPPSTLEINGLTIDLARREVCRGADPIHLTKLEFGLLRELVTHPDKVLSYAHLLSAVWGGGDDVRPVHVHVSNLRRKIEPGPPGPRHIIAVPGVGYRFRLTGGPDAPS
jgi:DNA-binding response OmpR family regulator